MISLILAESAIDLVPKEIQNHPSVISHAKKLGKKPNEILLDNSWHFAAMKGINNEVKRGRPDLVHFCILEACTIPLYLQNKIQIFIHTIDDHVIYFGKNVHIPKSYHRFEGLIEKLFLEKKIVYENKTLLEIKEKSFTNLIDEINPKNVIGFSVEGNLDSFENISSKIQDGTCLVIGGFQKGHFSNSTKNKINQMYSINKNSLEAHVVISRILYEYEKTVFM